MGQYCDSKVLEKNWFHWLLSSSVKDLEIYRECGVLWTKVVTNKQTNLSSKKPLLPNPRDPLKIHCIALGKPIYINSNNGVLDSRGYTIIHGNKKFVNLPTKEELSEESSEWIHNLDDPLSQMMDVIPNLVKEGYIKEIPTNVSWHAMLDDINQMCLGIAIRFKQQSEEDHIELANEALLQVIRKLVQYKLVYTPGLAPVFNLLTTTIHRCMYSIMNKRKTQRNGLQKFCDEVQSGVVPGDRYHIPNYVPINK